MELKPCPFCGGPASLREYGSGHKGNGEFTAGYECGCEKCRIKFRFESIFKLEHGQPKFIQNGYDKCVEAWNNRPLEEADGA